MTEHRALIERMSEQIAAGLRPPPTAAEVDAYVEEMPDVEDVPIGRAAALLGILPTTIRYYEDAGLLCIPRRANGHRVFDRATLGDLLLVHAMRLSGMPVQEIARLREHLADPTPAGRSRATAPLEHHAERMRREIARLQITLAITEHKQQHLIGETP